MSTWTGHAAWPATGWACEADPVTDATGAPEFEIAILDLRAVDEMVGKIRAAAAVPGAADAVTAWREQHGREAWEDIGHDHAVVGTTLMYLHDAPDGLLVPHVRYPDGTEKIYTDAAHADALF
jgi:hypothetical protein